MKKYIFLLLLIFCNSLYSQDTTYVSYMQIREELNTVLIPIPPFTVTDTIYLYEGGFKYDTLEKVRFTYAKRNKVMYDEGFIIQQSVRWSTPYSIYGGILNPVQQYIVNKKGKKFLFKNYSVDLNSQIIYNSRIKKRKWFQSKNKFILNTYDE
jgi:hypothetical protein